MLRGVICFIILLTSLLAVSCTPTVTLSQQGKSALNSSSKAGAILSRQQTTANAARRSRSSAAGTASASSRASRGATNKTAAASSLAKSYAAAGIQPPPEPEVEPELFSAELLAAAKAEMSKSSTSAMQLMGFSAAEADDSSSNPSADGFKAFVAGYRTYRGDLSYMYRGEDEESPPMAGGYSSSGGSGSYGSSRRQGDDRYEEQSQRYEGSGYGYPGHGGGGGGGDDDDDNDICGISVLWGVTVVLDEMESNNFCPKRKPESLALVTEVEEFLEDMLAGVGCTQASADAEIVSVYCDPFGNATVQLLVSVDNLCLSCLREFYSIIIENPNLCDGYPATCEALGILDISITNLCRLLPPHRGIKRPYPYYSGSRDQHRDHHRDHRRNEQQQWSYDAEDEDDAADDTPLFDRRDRIDLDSGSSSGRGDYFSGGKRRGSSDDPDPDADIPWHSSSRSRDDVNDDDDDAGDADDLPWQSSEEDSGGEADLPWRSIAGRDADTGHKDSTKADEVPSRSRSKSGSNPWRKGKKGGAQKGGSKDRDADAPLAGRAKEGDAADSGSKDSKADASWRTGKSQGTHARSSTPAVNPWRKSKQRDNHADKHHADTDSAADDDIPWHTIVEENGGKGSDADVADSSDADDLPWHMTVIEREDASGPQPAPPARQQQHQQYKRRYKEDQLPSLDALEDADADAGSLEQKPSPPPSSLRTDSRHPSFSKPRTQQGKDNHNTQHSSSSIEGRSSDPQSGHSQSQQPTHSSGPRDRSSYRKHSPAHRSAVSWGAGSKQAGTAAEAVAAASVELPAVGEVDGDAESVLAQADAVLRKLQAASSTLRNNINSLAESAAAAAARRLSAVEAQFPALDVDAVLAEAAQLVQPHVKAEASSADDPATNAAAAAGSSSDDGGSSGSSLSSSSSSSSSKTMLRKAWKDLTSMQDAA